jgi:two-component system sensor histidine kinase UhpB
LNILKSQLPNDDRARLGSRLDDAMKLVEETVMRLRLVMAELRPPALDDYGLGAALHWFADQFSQRTGIPVNVEDAEMPRLPSMVELGLFRIAQEALNNIAKHANPSQAKIRLTEEGGSIRLEIMDDGIGFNPATTRPRKDGGWGLPSMREQAEAFGGSLTVLSAPGKGARVAVSVRRMSDGFEDYTGG